MTAAKIVMHHVQRNRRDVVIELFADGEFESLRLLYQGYCAKTNWPINSPPKAFFPTHERREGVTTKCFGVEFADGTNGTFSLGKALSAVAN